MALAQTPPHLVPPQLLELRRRKRLLPRRRLRPLVRLLVRLPRKRLLPLVPHQRVLSLMLTLWSIFRMTRLARARLSRPRLSPQASAFLSAKGPQLSTAMDLAMLMVCSLVVAAVMRLATLLAANSLLVLVSRAALASTTLSLDLIRRTCALMLRLLPQLRLVLPQLLLVLPRRRLVPRPPRLVPHQPKLVPRLPQGPTHRRPRARRPRARRPRARPLRRSTLPPNQRLPRLLSRSRSRLRRFLIRPSSALSSPSSAISFK